MKHVCGLSKQNTTFIKYRFKLNKYYYNLFIPNIRN